MSGKKQDNIQVYRKKWHFNIGVVIFGVILVYLLVTVLTYVTAKRVSSYEVREGSIYRDNAYTGLAIRQETVVNADAEGYINYFVPEGSKVGKHTNVYSLSPEKLELTGTGQEEGQEEAAQELSSEEKEMVLQQTRSFSSNFQDANFSDTYAFKDSVENILASSSSQSRQSQLAALLQSQAAGVSAYTSAEDGIVAYSVDGYEGMTLEQITPEMLSKADYKRTELTDNQKVQAGDAAYKLITDEEWTLIIELSDDMAQELADTTDVQVRFSKDGETAWGGLIIYNMEDTNLGFITFHESMVRYASDRFLDIQLILEDETGLKIPKSAVVEKEFCLLPQDYLTQGGNSSNTGVLIQKGGDTARFEEAKVYYRDNETDMVYLDADAFDKGTVILKPDSGETYTLSETGSLHGVYNINKGYAEFIQVQILCENEEYYIVASGSDYGLVNYDHIALDGSDIHEDEIVIL